MLVKDNYKISDETSVGTEIILLLDMTSKNFQKNTIKACKDGFKDPIIFLEDNKPILQLFGTFDHNFGNCKDWKNELKFVKFCINNFINVEKMNKNNKNCSMFITLEENAVEYLKGYTNKFKFSFKDKDPEQREISGKFDMLATGIDTVILKINEKSINMGQKESVDPMLSIGTFHSHPKTSYEKYKICCAYPSKDDYCTFLYIYSMGYGNFHIVSTVEGLYVISISEELMKYTLEEIKEDLKKYEKSIDENYGVDYPRCKIKPQIAIRKIYKYIKLINKKPYFKVQFVEWKNATKPIKINFKRIEGNCPIRDEQVHELLKKA
jgi:hypothetical protein